MRYTNTLNNHPQNKRSKYYHHLDEIPEALVVHKEYKQILPVFKQSEQTITGMFDKLMNTLENALENQAIKSQLLYDISNSYFKLMKEIENYGIPLSNEFKEKLQRFASYKISTRFIEFLTALQAHEFSKYQQLLKLSDSEEVPTSLKRKLFDRDLIMAKTNHPTDRDQTLTLNITTRDLIDDLKILNHRSVPFLKQVADQYIGSNTPQMVKLLTNDQKELIKGFSYKTIAKELIFFNHNHYRLNYAFDQANDLLSKSKHDFNSTNKTFIDDFIIKTFIEDTIETRYKIFELLNTHMNTIKNSNDKIDQHAFDKNNIELFTLFSKHIPQRSILPLIRDYIYKHNKLASVYVLNPFFNDPHFMNTDLTNELNQVLGLSTRHLIRNSNTAHAIKTILKLDLTDPDIDLKDESRIPWDVVSSNSYAFDIIFNQINQLFENRPSLHNVRILQLSRALNALLSNAYRLNHPIFKQLKTIETDDYLETTLIVKSYKHLTEFGIIRSTKALKQFNDHYRLNKINSNNVNDFEKDQLSFTAIPHWFHQNTRIDLMKYIDRDYTQKHIFTKHDADVINYLFLKNRESHFTKRSFLNIKHAENKHPLTINFNDILNPLIKIKDDQMISFQNKRAKLNALSYRIDDLIRSIHQKGKHKELPKQLKILEDILQLFLEPLFKTHPSDETNLNKVQNIENAIYQFRSFEMNTLTELQPHRFKLINPIDCVIPTTLSIQ